MKKNSVKKLALIGLMAALVFVTSKFLNIPLATPLGNTRIHLGNTMCLLSGMLLGPVAGGFAAGIGSMLFDLLDPVYLSSAPFTFAFKFAMAWICGMIAIYRCDSKKWRYIAGAAAGSLSYVVLYLSKSFAEDLILGHAFGTVLIDVASKGVTSLVNGLIAALISIPLALALRPLLKRSNLIPQ